MRPPAALRGLLAAGCLLLATPQATSANAPDATAIAEFQRRMQSPIEVTWANVPLRASLLRLGEAQQVAVFVDRRLDPGQPLSLRLRAATLRLGFQQLADQYDWQISEIANLVYVGPRPTTGKLATIVDINRDHLKKLPPEKRRAWQTRRPTEWPRLTEPAALLQQQFDEAGVDVKGLANVPHDLWDQGQLPALSLLERVTVLLAGFDLSVRLNADGSAKIVKIPRQVALRRTYRLNRSQVERIEELRQLLSQPNLAVNDRQVTVTATSEDHRELKQWLEGRQRPMSRNALAQRRYSLHVENQPLDGVLRSLCQQLDLELQMPDVPDDRRSQLIGFNVRNVTQAELLKKTVSQAGLTYHLDGRRLIVTQPPIAGSQ